MAVKLRLSLGLLTKVEIQNTNDNCIVQEDVNFAAGPSEKK